jgi:2-polyprenyl-6-methoxyphenol hydroxylase-like FAD-dependent oxidoreductase
MPRKLIIAGGGIGGMSAAIALRRAGIDVTVYERWPEFAEIGAGMSLWPNATRILKSWGLLEPLMAVGAQVEQFDLLKPNGDTISSISMGGFQTPAVCLHRADLHRALRSALTPACLEPNQRMVSFAPDEGLGVVAEFASGLKAGADGLIGADGVNSAVRTQLHGAGAPHYRGYRIWRGIAPDTGGSRAGHISETWGRGRRFGVMPIGSGRVCWYATRNGPASQPEGPEGCKREIQQLFAGWHNPVQALVEATDPADIITADARDRHPIRRWGEGRVTLLGDAAHPITPNVGQGACMAIEDAACLAKEMMNTPDVAAAFRAYEAKRRRRTARIGWQARHIGSIGQLENRWMVSARDLITRLVLKIPHDIRLNSVYAYET